MQRLSNINVHELYKNVEKIEEIFHVVLAFFENVAVISRAAPPNTNTGMPHRTITNQF